MADTVTIDLTPPPTLSVELLAGYSVPLQDLSGLLVKSANLSDLTNAATARTNLGLGNVENAAASGLYVALTGSQTVAGVKSFSNSIAVTGTLTINDTILLRDAANTLAQRNGTAAQTSRIYGTYTDASNYRRLYLTQTTGGAATIGVEGLGTGDSGNTLSILGNASTATKLATARNINGVPFDGSADITISGGGGVSAAFVIAMSVAL